MIRSACPSIAGIGSALIYTPGIVIVGQYFEKRRGLAAGLSAATSGLGTFAFPPLAELLFDNFAFMGGFLILGALALNACVSAALYRPLEDSLPKEMRRKLKKNRQAQKEKEERERAKQEEVEGKSASLLENGNSMLKDCARCDHKNAVSQYVDLELLKQPSFVCFAISSGLAATSNLASIPLIVDHGRDCGIPEHQAVFLVSAVGIADTIGRALGGVLFDLPCVKGRRRLAYCFIILMAGAAVYLWALSSTFELLVAFCLLQVRCSCSA
jgi:MFS family permease